MSINIEKIKLKPTEEQKIELVERKGLGHPDYMADSIAESFSRELCREYIKRFGVILHHNVDKLDVVGGQTKPKFGGGEVLKEILVFFSGRATQKVENQEIPISEIAIKTAKNWIRNNLRFLDPEKHVRYQVETKGGAGNLTDVYKRKDKIIGANDTSFGVGFAPLTETEKTVFEAERYLNSKDFKKEYPFSGEDIKIMGLREGKNLYLTVAMSFVDKYVKNSKDYIDKKNIMISKIKNFAETKTAKNKVRVYLNTIDEPKRGEDGCYLTVTGTSAEHGDDGAVGRGNRINGLITPNRFMSLEAAAGKNPVNHVGKMYNILALQIANKVYAEVSGIREIIVRLLSQIGRPINQPKSASAQVILKKGVALNSVKQKIQSMMENEIANITKITNLVIEDKIDVC